MERRAQLARPVRLERMEQMGPPAPPEIRDRRARLVQLEQPAPQVRPAAAIRMKAIAATGILRKVFKRSSASPPVAIIRHLVTNRFSAIRVGMKIQQAAL